MFMILLLIIRISMSSVSVRIVYRMVVIWLRQKKDFHLEDLMFFYLTLRNSLNLWLELFLYTMVLFNTSNLKKRVVKANLLKFEYPLKDDYIKAHMQQVCSLEVFNHS